MRDVTNANDDRFDVEVATDVLRFCTSTASLVSRSICGEYGALVSMTNWNMISAPSSAGAACTGHHTLVQLNAQTVGLLEQNAE